MSELPKLNFPAIRLRARRRGAGVEVWDSLRGIYLVLTPEEWVRQHLIAYLVSHCGVQPMRVVQEFAVALNGQPQRADVVVVDDRPSRCCWPSARLRASPSGGRRSRRPCVTIRCSTPATSSSPTVSDTTAANAAMGSTSNSTDSRISPESRPACKPEFAYRFLKFLSIYP